MFPNVFLTLFAPPSFPSCFHSFFLADRAVLKLTEIHLPLRMGIQDVWPSTQPFPSLLDAVLNVSKTTTHPQRTKQAHFPFLV